MNTILDTIGNTPLVELKHLLPGNGVRLFAKLEGSNPGGSIKDRIAYSMITEAEKSGALTPDKTILEASSGNTGIGLALVAAVKGYRTLIVMSEGVSVERRQVLQALGAEIYLTPAARGTDGAIEFTYTLAKKEPGQYYLADQFNNPANWRSHYEGTAPEIIRDTGGEVSHVVAAMGTSGTLMGLSRYFRDRHLPVKVVGAEPLPGHRIQGTKNMQEAYLPGIYRRDLLDGHHYVPDEEAYHLARQLAVKEGIFAGMSAGAALYAALKTAKQLHRGNIVVIIPDRGEKYLSTPLYNLPAKNETSGIIKP